MTIPAELGSALQQATVFMLTVRRCPLSVVLRPSPTARGGNAEGECSCARTAGDVFPAKADDSADGSSQSGAGWADVRAVKPPAIGPQSSNDHRLAFLCKLVCCRDASHSRARRQRP